MNRPHKSTALDWILRILFFFIAVLSIGILILNLVSGTGDPQRRGLEQAFSDSLGVTISIGTLNNFNVLPQFTIDISDLKSDKNEHQKIIEAGRIRIAFSLLDLLQNKKTIQNLDIDKGKFYYPAFSANEFTNISSKIEPPTINNNQATFTATATINENTLNISIPMNHTKSGINFNYSIRHPVQIKATYKSCVTMGTMKTDGKIEWDISTSSNTDCSQFLELFRI
jgi:hypothetical protein